MKKILCLTLILTVIAGSAFARTQLDPAGAVSTAAATIYAGTAQASLDSAVNPTAKLSTGVSAVAVYLPTGYSINTKHVNGSKVFGTSHDSTAIYWKASASKVIITVAESTSSAVPGDTNYNNASNGWTAY